MMSLKDLYLHIDERLEIISSILILYLSTALYFTRVWAFQFVAVVLLTFLGVAITLRAWFGLYRLNRATLGLVFSSGARDSILGLALAFLGWWLFSEYLYLTRGYRLAIGLSQSSSLIVTIFCIATAEEIFFRSYAHARLSKWLSPPTRVLAVSVALAGYKNLVHFWELQPILYHIELFAVTFMLSIPLSIWREASRSVAGPVVTHVVWDLLVYGALNEIPGWVF